MRVIAFHTLHDANVSIAVDGEVLVTLELERLFNVRYFCSAPRRKTFKDQWESAIGHVCQFTGIDEFDVGITSWVLPSQQEVLRSLVNAKRWTTVDHHACHASLGFWDSPFSNALVFSYDGGGNDGTFNVFLGDRDSGLTHLEWVGLNLGTPYRQLAVAMPEVTKEKFDPDDTTTYMRLAPLALSGKVMGYAAYGKVRPEWIPHFRDFYEKFVTPLTSLYTLGERTGLNLENNALKDDEARDAAATSQHVFETLFVEVVQRLLESHGQCIDGIVITGGCALNVNANQAIVERFRLPVHVPPAPNDCGISCGACWMVDKPKTKQRTQYLGLMCFDSNMLPNYAIQHGARKVEVAEVAKLLLDGAIIGVVRGRQEFGPRALGHRSILCYPNRKELIAILNNLKSREWFRPLCPSIAFASVPKLFDEKTHMVPIVSPYMSFAPVFTADAQRAFPAVTHHDGTARLQTVSGEDDPWFHSLLTAVSQQAHDGVGILLNTSFNVKGKPILNRISTALKILDESPEATINYVLVEEWLFEKKMKKKKKQTTNEETTATMT